MAFSEPTEDIELMRPPEGEAHSLNADEDVTRGQVVKLGSDNSCEPSDTDGEDTFGVAAQTVSSGDQVMVLGNGARVHYTAGSGSISAGDPLTSHGGTGEEGQVDTGDATGDRIIGYALEGSSSQGDLVAGVIDREVEVN